MPRTLSPAAGHRRTRRDHAEETAADYVEAIAELSAGIGACRVRDLAQRFGVSHVTVIRTVARLVRDDLARSEPYGPIELTKRGHQLAKLARQRHATVYDFLVALGVSPATAKIDSEGMEHHVSPETLRHMKRYVRSSQEPTP
ncbi:MAG TPA: manganese-binding transcriptional regulator MntR [Pirellulaceae bacterium]